VPCPVGNPGGYRKGSIGHGISDLFPYTVDIGTGATDILFAVRVQIQYNNGPITSDTPYTFVVTFTVTGATHPTFSYTGQATVTAKKA
jgi:hypothetical protein